MTAELINWLPGDVTGNERDRRLYLVALALLALGTLLGLAALRLRRLDVLAAAVSGAGALAWLLLNRPGEIRLLLEVRPGNGLTVADLFVVPAALLVLRLVVARWRS